MCPNLNPHMERPLTPLKSRVEKVISCHSSVNVVNSSKCNQMVLLIKDVWVITPVRVSGQFITQYQVKLTINSKQASTHKYVEKIT